MIAECWSSELCDLSLHIYEYLDERNVELKIKGALGLLIFSHYIILKHLTTFFSSSVTSHHTHTVTRRKETRLKKTLSAASVHVLSADAGAAPLAPSRSVGTCRC